MEKVYTIVPVRRYNQFSCQQQQFAPSFLSSLLTPSNRDARPEILDAPFNDEAALAVNLADIRAVNRWLGDTDCLLRLLEPMCRDRLLSNCGPITLLDIATGSADVPLMLHRRIQKYNLPLCMYASDISMVVLQEARHYAGETLPLICHDALALPYPDKSFDIVTCSKALHHFDPWQVLVLFRELARVTRYAAVVSDLNRSWIAYAGAHMLGMVQKSDISRHDGPLSVLRAYTAAEVCTLIQQAGLRGYIASSNLLRIVLVIEF